MRTLAFAHRGGTDGGHPENSLAAFADARARGGQLESDVRLSADGEPVLVHDGFRLRRGLPVIVGRASARRLGDLGIPTLADLYRELGAAFELSLDLKVVGAAAATLEVARGAGAVERLWLVHDDVAVLDRIRAGDDRVRLVHEARADELRRLGRTPLEHLTLLADHRIDAANSHWTSWSAALVDAAAAAGVLAFGSLVQEVDAMRAAARLGLDALYSDHLDALLAALAEADPPP